MNSRAKGKRGENLFCHWLRQWELADGTPVEARRGVQFGKGSHLNPDVISNLPVHWECKNTNRLRIHSAISQALVDANGTKPAIVAYKANFQDWVAILTMDQMMEFLGAKRAPECKGK